MTNSSVEFPLVEKDDKISYDMADIPLDDQYTYEIEASSRQLLNNNNAFIDTTTRFVNLLYGDAVAIPK